jgi:hypothetical protein
MLLLLCDVIEGGMWISATVFRSPDARMWTLASAARRAVNRGAVEKAGALARELLTLAGANPRNWNHGNAVHEGHLVLGRAALAVGDIETATAELLAAGRTPGSPQLNSFGPNMRLAEDLLRSGQRDPVLRYFELCRLFWRMERGRLNEWAADVKTGRTPRFGANLDY